MKKSKSLLVLAVLVSLVMVIPALAGPSLAIDTFDGTAQQVVQTTVGETYDVETGTMVGGERDVIVEVTEIGGGSSITANFNNNSSSLFAHSQDTGYKGRTTVIWDGTIDPDDGTVDINGLGGVDLTAGGVAQSLAITLLESDASLFVELTVYNAFDECASLRHSLVDLGNTEVPAIIPFYFSDFSDAGCAGGTLTDFSSIGAIKLEVDGTSVSSVDLAVDWFDKGLFDYGDLPSGYGTLVADQGPAHFVPAIPDLYFGESVDAEVDGLPNAIADGDDQGGTGDDEDGVSPEGNWTTAANSGAVDIDVVGTGCVTGWIDWNDDGDFVQSLTVPFPMVAWDTNELIISNVKQSGGSHEYNFTPGEDPANNSYYARFRLFPTDAEGNCPTIPTFTGTDTPEVLTVWLEGVASNGEVEDYQWGFGTNAVVASGMAAGANFGVISAAVMGAVAVAGAFVARKRK